MLPVQPTGPAISLELDVDDGEVENYEVCLFLLVFLFVIFLKFARLCFGVDLWLWFLPSRLSWTLLSVSERLSSEAWPRETSNSFLPIDLTQITISLNKHCECCQTQVATCWQNKKPPCVFPFMHTLHVSVCCVTGVWCVWVILSPASCCESYPAATSSMGNVWTSGWG